jgi:DEAD/DEAH box helicase domain-containing protein
VVFDLETKLAAQDVGGWDHVDKLGLALAVVYHVRERRYETFFEADATRLIETLKRAELVVGFNHIGFDYTVLRGYGAANLAAETKNLDMLLDVKRRLNHRLSLNAIAEASLGAKKSADGLQSLEWVRQGRLDLVEEYCRRDVEITHKVWRYGAEHGQLLYKSRDGAVLKVPVDWK